MNPTNDPALRSFLPVTPESHFPIQNLPWGVFSRQGRPPHIGVAIGDFVLDLNALTREEWFAGTVLHASLCFLEPTLNPFLALGPEEWSTARRLISTWLRHDYPDLRDDATLRERVLIPRTEVTMHLPVQIGDYTDFYSSREHATNVGAMLRSRENALMPNWLHLPVAYHGRSSSIVVSGTPVRRPCGQTKADTAEQPTFGPSRALDFELEMGLLVGPGNELGQPIPIAETPRHIFGLVLVNDWSARDIQKWEYQPLGPFLAKNFATSISPWVVSLEALQPFRTPGPAQEPEPLPYLRSPGNWALDVHLEVELQAPGMTSPQRICSSNSKYLYWNICQQLAHHTVNGCNLRPGDLLASGTISGPTPESYGSLLELVWKGTRPIELSEIHARRIFLEDGDTITLRGWCEGPGYRVGFGEVVGQITPAAV